jgi:hypothetical protein
MKAAQPGLTIIYLIIQWQKLNSVKLRSRLTASRESTLRNSGKGDGDAASARII